MRTSVRDAKRTLLKNTTLECECIYQFETTVVQITFNDSHNQLLASCLTASVIIDFASKTATQVGKQLRDGKYGATHFLSATNGSVILAARPQGRMWRAETSGVVRKTLNFENSLSAPMKLFPKPSTGTY